MFITALEAVELTGLPTRTVYHWMEHGWLVPTQAGERGRGLGCGLTLKQVLLLCQTAAMHKLYGCGGAWLEDHPIKACACPECQYANKRLLELLLGGDVTAWKEEMPAGESFFVKGSEPDNDWKAMVERLGELVRKKHGKAGGVDRIKAKAAK